MAAIEKYVSTDDQEYIWRILTKGCPEKSVSEEPARNKKTFIYRGNNPSIKAHWKVVEKTLNKEEQNHHIKPFPHWMCQ